MKSKTGLFENLATGIMVICAVGVLALMVRRELAPSMAYDVPRPSSSRAVSNFAALATSGHRFGPPDAPVTIVEFADFECPVCRGFENNTLRPIQAAFPGKVAVVFHHWPLSYHRFALPAARAAECAGNQDRFEAYRSLLFTRQDSIGLKSFTSYAIDAGIPDTSEFNRCISSSEHVAIIDEDVAMAKQLKLFGTPSVLIDGVLLGNVPDKRELDSLVRAHLAQITVK